MITRHCYIKTFGCQMNERDSEIIEQLLAQGGYVPVGEMEQADLVVLNTCSIRAKAEQKVYSLLGQLRLIRERQKPDLRVIVAGCVAQQEGSNLLQRMPHVNIVVGTQQVYQIPEMLQRLDSGQSKQELATDLSASFEIPSFQKIFGAEAAAPSPTREYGFRKFVNIMQGCNNYCAYCVVPATRGREISRPVRDILDETQILVDRGVKEITLLGQNVNSYGKTNAVADKPVSFPELLRMVAAIKGLKRLRFTTSNPKDLSEELMRCFAELDVLCPQFHLPVQSGSNAVLQRMNRKYTVELYKEKVTALRGYRPDIALTTDIIVGFPGESDEDFEGTMDLLETVRYHGSFSFKYSDRPGTRSADFPDKVDEEVKSQRLARFQGRQDEISLERNREYMGKILEVMVEKADSETGRGRTGTNHIVHFQNSNEVLVPGDLVEVRIEHAGKHSLKGTLVNC